MNNMTNQKLNNLLKDPNTNWKYVAVAAIVAVLVSAGLLAYQNLWPSEISLPEIPETEEVLEEKEGKPIAGGITYINVLAPNGGEEWKIGEKNFIKWSFSSDVERATIVTVELLTETGLSIGFIADIELIATSTIQTSSYWWTFDHVITRRAETIPLEPGNYLIRLSTPSGETGFPGISDISDSFFSLVL